MVMSHGGVSEVQQALIVLPYWHTRTSTRGGILKHIAKCPLLILRPGKHLRNHSRAVQTEEECLKYKDDLLDRIAELRERQPALIDKIQSVQLELEAEKIAARSRSNSEVVDVAVGCEPEKSWISLCRRTCLF
ncbi:hypothetical protein J6590_077068 [Homalodisca vitripennis]|nr:hypothetical protein J6590_077068 [Homalodisca vitripennis]